MPSRISHNTFLLVVVLISLQSTYGWISPSVLTIAPKSRRGYSSREVSSVWILSSSPRFESEYGYDTDDDDDDDEDENDSWIYDNLEVLDGSEDDDEEDWVPDGVKAQGRRKPTHLTPAKEVIKTYAEDDIKSTGATTETRKGPSPYTEEEEELIAAMGGRTKQPFRREVGYLGDCTLSEIAMDYSVPICYLADVLAMWGVPVPINVQDRLGDLVTGEQAFAIVEAVNSLDVGDLQDRYSNFNLMQLCNEWDMDLKEVFEFAMKEGWNLPFGVRTNLRVEQEEELLRVFSSIYKSNDDY